jgi:hypothetical protein
MRLAELTATHAARCPRRERVYSVTAAGSPAPVASGKDRQMKLPNQSKPVDRQQLQDAMPKPQIQPSWCFGKFNTPLGSFCIFEW